MRTGAWIGLFGTIACLSALAVPAACGDDDSGTPDVTDARDNVSEDTGPNCAPLVNCGGTCFDTQSSPQHCGECDNECVGARDCVAGVCTLRCPTVGEYDDCGGEQCANLESDPANCGACGEACESGESCMCGACVAECSSFDTDNANCGECGIACGGDTPVCCCGTCAASCDGVTCDPPLPEPEACVTGACTDLRWDQNNCGSCGNACNIMTGERCGNLRCTTAACARDEVYCDGRCVDPSNDNANCGRCAHACDIDLEQCIGGNCVPS